MCTAVALVEPVLGVALVADQAPLLHRVSSVTLGVRLGLRLGATAQPVPPPVHVCTAVALVQHVMGRRAAVSSVWVAEVSAVASKEFLAAVACELMAEVTAVILAIASSVARRLCCRHVTDGGVAGSFVVVTCRDHCRDGGFGSCRAGGAEEGRPW